MATAQAIISKSLRLLGVIASGDSPTASESSDGLDDLNSLVDSWSADPRFRFCEQDEFWTLVATQSNYSIGNAALTISTLVGVTTTATATTLGPHGLVSGMKVTVSGATPSSFNVTAVATVTSANTFTYPTASYTGTATGTPVVTAGDFYTDRPIRIVGAFTTLASVDSPLGIVTEQYWANVTDKSTTGATQTKILYRPNYPFGQIIVYPVPTGTPVLHIKSEKAVSQFSSLSAVKLLPPGYQRMMELALAIEMAPGYNAKVDQTTIDSIKSSYQSIIESNMFQIESSKIGEVNNAVQRT